MSPSRPPQADPPTVSKTAAKNPARTPAVAAADSAAPGRELSRKKEEEGRLPPDGKRRKAAQAQDAALKPPHRKDALDPKDAQKVPEHREPGPAAPAARGRDAPVDVR